MDEAQSRVDRIAAEMEAKETSLQVCCVVLCRVVYVWCGVVWY